MGLLSPSTFLAFELYFIHEALKYWWGQINRKSPNTNQWWFFVIVHLLSSLSVRVLLQCPAIALWPPCQAHPSFSEPTFCLRQIRGEVGTLLNLNVDTPQPMSELQSAFKEHLAAPFFGSNHRGWLVCVIFRCNSQPLGFQKSDM